MKKRKIWRKFFYYFFIAILAVGLVTIGIDAVDHYDNLSDSVVGHLFFQGADAPCPAEMVFVPSAAGGFCLDKYEAAAGRRCPHQEIGNQLMTRENLDAPDCAPESRAGAQPWRFISQTQAMAVCAKAGKRLPTGEEWFKAALGTPDKAAGWGADDCQVDSNWPSQPGPAGTGRNCVSSFGAYDMVGNVWEWIKDEAVDGVYRGRALPATGYVAAVDTDGLAAETRESEADQNFGADYFWIKASGVRGLARGGYWQNKADSGLYAVYIVSPTSFAGTGIGFRCAK